MLWLAAAAIAATILAYRRAEQIAADARAAEVISPKGMTAQAAANAPANPSFELVPAGELPAAPPAAATGPDNATARAFRQAAMEFNALLDVTAPAQPVRASLDLAAVHRTVMHALEPARAFSQRLAPQLKVGNLAATKYSSRMYHDISIGGTDATVPDQRIVPILAYPDIKKPMYKPLNGISSDLFVPNLHLIPPNTISLMLTNQPFIEAYMVGVNYEFGRELLWREYPTDQRGSPFRQFWDPTNYVNRDNLPPKDFAEKVRDIPRIHEWRSTDQLGDHNHRATQGEPAQLVLVIRGDLLKRYPNTIIYAQAARWGTRPEDELRLVLWDESGERIEQNPKDPNIRFPIVKAEVPPDIHFIGFDLTLEQVRGHKDLAETAQAKASIPATQLGWFFVLQEVVGEPRFGLDEERPTSPSNARLWDNLSWENLGADVKVIDVAKPFETPLEPASAPTGGLTWGGNAADMASILYQKPVLVGVHARDMLKNLKT